MPVTGNFRIGRSKDCVITIRSITFARSALPEDRASQKPRIHLSIHAVATCWDSMKAQAGHKATAGCLALGETSQDQLNRTKLGADLAVIRNFDTRGQLVVDTDDAADHFVHLLGVTLVFWPLKRVLPDEGDI